MIVSLHRGLRMIGARQDLVIVGLLVTAIMMMILPLPTWLVDILIAVNLSAAVLLLMMALYLKEPLDFSTLPSVILIVTIFRLALSITTTRLILLQADAGSIVETFGQFVISGNIVVGLVIFLIITIVQFVVITKGAERVAEVSARFTLDALPGKQMSVDSDLRNGDIDQAEARRRRRTMEKESQFYGAMDGAMKFVKGDAIAGLVIIAVNLIGGIAVGTMQQKLSAGEAANVYSLLTIGDGLASQLPALFVSLAAGSIITRVATDDSKNLGSDITKQMFASQLSVRVAAVVLGCLGFVPGFPTFVFLLLAAGMMALSFSDAIGLKIFGAPEMTEAETAAAEAAAAEGVLDPANSPFVVKVAAGMVGDGDPAAFAEAAQVTTTALNDQLGLTILPPRLAVDPEADPGAVRFELDDVPVQYFSVPPGMFAAIAEEDALKLAGVAYQTEQTPPPGFDRLHWVSPDAEPALRAAGLRVLRPVELLMRAAEAGQRRYAAQCIGVQETRFALSTMARQYPDLATEVRDIAPLNKLSEVFRRLIDEGVPIRNQRLLLEAVVEWGAKEQDPVVLTEYVRTALKRQICHSVANEERVIPVYLMDRTAEDAIREAIRQTTVGEYLALDDAMSAKLVQLIRDTVKRPLDGGVTPTILTSLDVRRFVRSLLVNNGMRDVHVLSYHDLSSEFTVTPLASIGLN